MNKINYWMTPIRNLLEPKVGTAKWFRSASTEAIKEYREELWNKLMNPNEDSSIRIQIRDHILPHIDKILHNRDN